MKFKLMVQSLSPLALLTIVKNFKFVLTSSCGEKLSFCDFICQNLVLLIVMLFCFIWIALAVIYLIHFGAFKWVDKESGYEVQTATEDKEASLNFFVTLIIPLLLDDVNTIQGALSFLLIMVLLCILLYRTNLFYANPILAILGYRIYSFTFKDNKSYSNKTCIGLCKGKLKSRGSIEYKNITENVLYIKEMKK